MLSVSELACADVGSPLYSEYIYPRQDFAGRPLLREYGAAGERRSGPGRRCWTQDRAVGAVRRTAVRGVEPTEDGWGTEITKVVLVVNPEQMPLARDATGHFLVYDENFDR